MADSSIHRVALYGGTFDPVHEGHVTLAQAAAEAIPLDRVVFLPAFRSPHKQGIQTTSGEHRAAMLDLALEGADWAQVSRWELERESPSYSWKTTEHFHAEWTQQVGEEFRLYWILGHDQWEALPRWSRPDRLAELLHFIVFPRNGESPEPREGFQMTAVERRHPASGTAIRNAIREGREPEGLAPVVQEYIRLQGLYPAAE